VDRLLRDAGGEQTLTSYDTNGDLADVNGAEAPTVVVTDSGGTAVAGFTAARTSTGVYKLTLPGNLEVLDNYSVVWSWTNGQSRRTSFELIGGFLFALAELRAFDAVLANETTYPDARLLDVREAVEERMERNARVAFRPRGAREFLDGDGGRTLILQHRRPIRVVAASVAGTALTAGELEDLALYPTGKVIRRSGTWGGNEREVEVLYEHGYEVTPAPVHEAALRFARHVAVKTVFDDADRATAAITELGGYRLTIAGRDGPTGLPEVDAVIKQFGVRTPGFA
jgi:hypothetical protein